MTASRYGRRTSRVWGATDRLGQDSILWQTGMAAAVALLALPNLLAAPVVTGFSPASGPPGTQVTINGSGFSAANLVQFNSTPGDFQGLSASRIVATVPLEATDGPIRVSDSSGSGSSGSTFFLPAPRITTVSPDRGATNTTVVINGANFRDNATVSEVRFGGVLATFSVTTPDQIHVTVPAGATNAPITIVTPAGRVTTTNPFVVVGPAPIIDGFQPPWGAPGSTLVVRGVNFGSAPQVKFGNTVATSSAPMENQINATVPNLAEGGVPLTVTTSLGAVTTSTNFIVTLAPIITNVVPTIGKPEQTEVVIEGVNWSRLADIYGVGFNGRAVSSLGMPVPGRLQVKVPAGATTGPITVTNNLGGVRRVGASPSPFIITNAPVIEVFAPEIGTPGVTVVTVTGFNLSNGPTVLRFNQTTAPFFKTTATPERIAATVPAGATTGPLSLSNGFGVFVTPNVFSVIGDKPFITGFTPVGGPRGTTVNIEGRNFFNPVTVRFNGVQAPETFATTATRMTVTVPADARTGPLTVTTPNGTSTNQHIFYAAPRLSGFTPAAGVVGSTATLTGLNFTNAAAIEFGGVPAAVFTVLKDTNLTATVPLEALSGPLRVVTPGGVVLSTTNFTVLPAITEFEPTLGPEGTLVTIRGTSFRNVTRVAFNGRAATTLEVDSPQQIRAAVPAGATPGRIVVTTADGAATSATDFVVTAASDLRLSMAPSSTLVAPGTPVAFDLQVTNRGPSAVTRVRLINTLPAGLVFTNAAVTQGSVTHNQGVVTADLGVVLVQGTAGLTLETVTAGEGVWSNRATVSAIEPDDNPTDNTAATGVVVLSDASATLQIGRVAATNAVVLRWPMSPVPLRLQFAEDLATNSLAPVVLWQTVPGTPAASGGFNRVTNGTAGDQRHYRLHWP